MEATAPKMAYRNLGNTGLRVSVLSYGTWLTAHDPKSEQQIIDCIKRSYELGVNFFDTAEIYGAGVAETIMGKGLKELNAPREELVISTKLMKCGSGVNDGMLSRKHLIEGMKNSLKRLQLDYVDVVFCHRPDCQTPMIETCRAMDWIVEEGYAYYWATSEWSSSDIAQAHEICEREGLNKPIADQCEYSAIMRENFEKNLRHSYENYKYGTTIWSPMAGGILSGKYNSGVVPEDSRYSSDYAKNNLLNRYFGDKIKDNTMRILKGFEEISKELGCSQAQLALAWTLVNSDTSTCIFGASKIEQVEDNVQALQVAINWTQELEDRIEKLLDNQPEPVMDFNEFSSKKSRRQVALDCGMSTKHGRMHP
jgi:voltage-dependent potassium channel beta subunit